MAGAGAGLGGTWTDDFESGGVEEMRRVGNQKYKACIVTIRKMMPCLRLLCLWGLGRHGIDCVELMKSVDARRHGVLSSKDCGWAKTVIIVKMAFMMKN